MRIWKFIIPADDAREDGAGNVWMGMGAAVVAESEGDAREALRVYASLHADGHAGWLAVADVTNLAIEAGAVALWTEV